MQVEKIMGQVNKWVKDILGDNYVGISLRLDSFNPNRSDLDFIIVVKKKLDAKTKEQIWDKMLENEKLFPKKGFEFSVVLEENCRNIKHPIPYELHGSRDWIERYRTNKSLIINDEHKVDPDLASHFNVINVPNDNLDFGKPSRDVFAKVPKEYIIDSNYRDVLECADNIVDNPVYCILNLCRFYALLKDGLTLSKYGGGEWAIDNMDSSYPDVIKQAMDDYKSDDDSHYDNDRLKKFADEAIQKINHLLVRVQGVDFC